MDLALQLATVTLTGLLALERGAKHCGLFSGVRHLDISCSKCLALSLSRNASNAWSQTDVPIPHRRASYDLANWGPSPPAVVQMERGVSAPDDGKNEEVRGVRGE